ncbi:MAG: arsenate reductase ArsC [Elusimicrobiota bacterium]|nr:arsenate reductase ArsC [Endomicrobiia bacterium]MDW8166097.1 arsenate reductase ArsC [Elusimicrobiota bacterium]
MKKKVLFVCTHNSNRSQIAEALLNYLYPQKYQAYSAGTNPSKVNDYAIKVLKEIGIDISNNRSKHIEEFKDEFFDFVVTVCDSAKETCPFFPNAREFIHKSFYDPSGYIGTEEEKLEKFRQLREEIKKFLIEKFG